MYVPFYRDRQDGKHNGGGADGGAFRLNKSQLVAYIIFAKNKKEKQKDVLLL